MAKAAEEQPPTPAAAEDSRPAAAAEDDDDGDSEDDGSVDMSTWTPEEIAGFNKVCVRNGLGIIYTS